MSALERRTFQRLKLPRPMQAVVGGLHALILDVGMSGVYVEHFGKVGPGDRFALAFRWQGSDIEYTCEVSRSRVIRPAVGVQPALSHTGARFVSGSAGAEELVVDMIATFVGRILAAQRGNANPASPDAPVAGILTQLGAARRSRATGWVTCRIVDGTWCCAYTMNPKQPPDGFTVGAFEDEDEIDELRQTYAAADDEGRRLIRLVAELSASAVTQQTS